MPRPPTEPSFAATALGALVLLAAGCGAPSAVVDPSPTDVALAVHVLPALSDQDPASLRSAVAALVHPEVLPDDVGALLDAVQALPRGRLAVRSAGTLAGLDRTAVELDVLSSGSGGTRYEIHLHRDGSAWKLRWLGGPAESWPAPPRPRGPALSTSAEPDPG